MKVIFLSTVIPLALASALAAQTQTCREVVRDASGRVVQTVERRKQAGGTVQAVSRDAAGRVIGTATTRPTSGGGSMPDKIQKLLIDQLNLELRPQSPPRITSAKTLEPLT